MRKKHENGSDVFIHFDPVRVEYSISEAELAQLEAATGSVWKDPCLVTVPLFLATALNAAGELSLQLHFELTLSLFLNSLIGSLSFFLCLAFGLAWKKSHASRKDLIVKIKAKPRLRLMMDPDSQNLIAGPEAQGEPSRVRTVTTANGSKDAGSGKN